MGIKERIYQLIEAKHLTPAAFERKLGMSNGYLRNTKGISADNCAKILSVFNDVSAEWLLLDKGSMFLSTPHTTNNVNGNNVCGVSGGSVDIKSCADSDVVLSLIKSHADVVAKMQSQLDKAQAQIDELINILKNKI